MADELLYGAVGAIVGFLAAVGLGAVLSGGGAAGAAHYETDITEYHPEGWHPDNPIVENKDRFF